MFYVISLKHTKKKDKYFTLWRANNAGYCFSKGMAGLYATPQVGYHDNENNMPVSVADAERMFERTIYEGQDGYMIHNNAKNQKALGLSWKAGELLRNRPEEQSQPIILQPGAFLPQFEGNLKPEVRALSWYQPYATLMEHGKLETRRQQTKVRGWVLICSCAKPYSYQQVIDISGEYQYKRICDTLLRDFSTLPTGVATSIGWLEGSREMKNTDADEDACYVQHRSGLWVWEFTNVKAIEPFEYKGKQGWGILNETELAKIIIK